LFVSEDEFNLMLLITWVSRSVILEVKA
jgi:hypothetical protein